MHEYYTLLLTANTEKTKIKKIQCNSFTSFNLLATDFFPMLWIAKISTRSGRVPAKMLLMWKKLQQKYCRAFVGFSSGSLAGDLLQAILTDFEEVNDEY